MRLNARFDGTIFVSHCLCKHQISAVSKRKFANPEHIICLPVPEKAQAQYMFCVIPYNRDGVNVPPTHEQIMWTVPNTLLKPSQVSGKLSVEGEEETYRSLLLRILNKCLQPFQKQVVVPNEKEFMSQAAQVYRKGERAVHVKAFRGSKDGEFWVFWSYRKVQILLYPRPRSNAIGQPKKKDTIRHFFGGKVLTECQASSSSSP